MELNELILLAAASLYPAADRLFPIELYGTEARSKRRKWAVKEARVLWKAVNEESDEQD